MEEYHGDAPFAGKYLSIDITQKVYEIFHTTACSKVTSLAAFVSHSFSFQARDIGECFQVSRVATSSYADNTIFHFHYKGLAHKLAF